MPFTPNISRFIKGADPNILLILRKEISKQVACRIFHMTKAMKACMKWNEQWIVSKTRWGLVNVKPGVKDTLKSEVQRNKDTIIL